MSRRTVKTDKVSQKDMLFHHIGCLVEDIEASKQQYGLMLGTDEFSETYDISSQGVKVCFVGLAGTPSFIELVEPTDETSSLTRLRKKGTNFYHLGFLVPNIDTKIEELESQDYRLVTVFQSEAFDNKKCAFLYSPDLHLIELIGK